MPLASVKGLFALLPMEVIEKVLMYLPARDLAHVERLSSYFSDLVAQGIFWRRKADLAGARAIKFFEKEIEMRMILGLKEEKTCMSDSHPLITSWLSDKLKKRDGDFRRNTPGLGEVIHQEQYFPVNAADENSGGEVKEEVEEEVEEDRDTGRMTWLQLEDIVEDIGGIEMIKHEIFANIETTYEDLKEQKQYHYFTHIKPVVFEELEDLEELSFDDMGKELREDTSSGDEDYLDSWEQEESWPIIEDSERCGMVICDQCLFFEACAIHTKIMGLGYLACPGCGERTSIKDWTASLQIKIDKEKECKQTLEKILASKKDGKKKLKEVLTLLTTESSIYSNIAVYIASEEGLVLKM